MKEIILILCILASPAIYKRMDESGVVQKEKLTGASKRLKFYLIRS